MKEITKQLQINSQHIIQAVEGAKGTHTPEHINIVAVTKTVDPPVMRELLQQGLHRFGENRVNSLLNKQEALADVADQIEWHFIGHLQTRPVRKIINKIDYLHSLDRLSLAKEVQKRANHVIKCFLQINVSGETSKSGINPDNIDKVLDTLSEYDKIRVVGLMTMAPINANENELHQQFSDLRKLQQSVEMKKLSFAPCHELSMGMSRDYKIAVKEGASFVRVGTAFFENIPEITKKD